MKTLRMKTILIAVAIALAAGTAFADGNHEWTGVNSKTAPPSPTGGSAQPGGISNIDDYTQQDDQIQIQGDKDAVVKVLRVNQKNLVNEYVPVVIELKNADPGELKNVFQEIAAVEGGRAEVIIDSKQGKNFLYFLVPRFQVPYIQAAVKALDVPWVRDGVDGSIREYYQAKFRSISNIANVVRVTAASVIGVAGGADDDLIVLDSINNGALIVGEPYRVNAFFKRAPEVDIPVPQVLVEAAVYEVEVTNEMRLGLDYIAWKNGPGRNLFDFIYWGESYKQVSKNRTSIFDPFVPANTATTGTTNGSGSGWYMGANYLLSSAYLDFLQGTGRARLVTRGKIMIKNAETGTLSATDQTLYFLATPDETTTTSSGITPSTALAGATATTIPIHNRELDADQKLDIGLTLTVTPYIATITSELAITLSESNIVGQTSAGTPQVRTHALSTNVLVRDGQPICIGGLRRTEDVKNTEKVPVLGSIPIVGYLFGHEATVKRETEMVVVITPRVELGSEAQTVMAFATPKDKLIRAQVERKAKLTLPKTEVGFDQWLMH